MAIKTQLILLALLIPVVVWGQGQIPVGKRSTPTETAAPTTEAVREYPDLFTPDTVARDVSKEELALRNNPTIATAEAALAARVARIANHMEAQRLKDAVLMMAMKDIQARIRGKEDDMHAMLTALGEYFNVPIPYTPLPKDVDPWQMTGAGVTGVLSKDTALEMVKRMLQISPAQQETPGDKLIKEIGGSGK